MCENLINKEIDLTGKEVGYLKVIKRIGKKKSPQLIYWSCECKCGKIVDKSGMYLKHQAKENATCGVQCPYYSHRITWNQYIELESMSGWKMLFDETEKPISSREERPWQHSCGNVEMKTYEKLQFNIRKNKKLGKKYESCKKCMHDWKRYPESEAAKRAEEKGHILIHYAGTIMDTNTILQCKKCGKKHKRSIGSFSSDCKICPHCNSLRINNVRASKPQVKIAKKINKYNSLEKFVNVLVGSKCVDIAIKKHKIAIEYDSWFYHSPSIPNKLKNDKKRNALILKAGWKLWRIKSNNLVPNDKTIKYALDQLINTDRKQFVTTLKDWGKGETWKEI